MDYKKILKQLTEKWPAKALSVVAAIFLFAFHRMSDFQERYFSVPLHVELPGNLVPGESYPRNVRITLRGTNAIYLISESDIEAYLDLSKHSEPGLYKAQVLVQRKGSAAETEILEIITEPAELSLELDTRMSKNLPLSANLQGYPESGFEIVSYNLEPNQMTIEGPAKLLQSLSEIQTDVIDLGGRSADFSTRVRIANPNQLFTLHGEGTTAFSCVIRETIIIHNYENLPISVRGLAGEFEAVLDPPTASVKIQGLERTLNDVSEEAAIALFVDCAEITEAGFYELPLLAEEMSDESEPAETEEALFVVPGEEEQTELIIDRLEPETIRVEIRPRADN